MKMYYVTIVSNFVKGFDKYKKVYSKEGLTHSTFDSQFFVLYHDELDIGINKAKKLLQKVGIKDDEIIVLETEITQKTYNDHATGMAQYIKQNYIYLENVYAYDEVGGLLLRRIEDVMAHSFELNFNLVRAYQKLRPRSISILPVKSGCQANCDFCFSTYSVSQDLEKGLLESNNIEDFLSLAKDQGASRAVITGGGEPTLIESTKLYEMIAQCATYFPQKVLLISNGYKYAMQNTAILEETFAHLQTSGLTNLSLSHHHYHAEKNTQIMKLHIPIENLLSFCQYRDFGIKLRLICVLQKEGIDSTKEIGNYLKWAGSYDVKEVCFKELYVSTSLESYYHTYEANDVSYAKQVPLSLIIDFCKNQGFTLSHTLPWGASVYTGTYQGYYFSIACYTEPSLYWELLHQTSRSWNIMSNGECLASLEDKESFIRRDDEF
jgi:hypothetical protein